ncbi:MAG: SanA/YdcF family protein [Minisyncoccota bacterium]
MKRLSLFAALGFLFLLVLIFATNVLFYVSTRSYLYDNAGDAPKADVALVLGAPLLEDGTPAPIFTDRIDTAIDVFKAGKVSKILVSGDNRTVTHDEVDPARLYLLSKGIPAQDILLDRAGFDTYSSMYHARTMFGVSSAIITTQSFHLPRAVFIARALGIQAYGVKADVGHVLFRNYVREVFADEKAVFNLVFHTKPKYLGNAVPIE